MLDKSIVKRLFIILAYLYTALNSWIKDPIKAEKEEISPPPKIIRTCCSFGSDLKVSILPIVKVTQIISIEDLGDHKYMGGRKEGNGIIYTLKGGFIDLGHLRDQADLTIYFYNLITRYKDNDVFNFKIGYEGGQKSLVIKNIHQLTNNEIIYLAGNIAYDLSVWHEIATWYGSSYIPFIPERYSSFSVEDIYSNLLGVLIGIEAIKSDLPNNEAMTLLIKSKLMELKAVNSAKDTYLAMKSVEGVWWTGANKLPSEKILIKRYFNAYTKLLPWLVPKYNTDSISGCMLELPKFTYSHEELSNYYELKIRLCKKFPIQILFPGKTDRIITQKDFNVFINQVIIESNC